MINYQIIKQDIKSFFRSKAENRHALVGPAKLWKMKRDFQIQFLSDRGLQPQNYFLDLGCGTLRGGIPIISFLEKEHYFGIDSRDLVIREARKELREGQLEYKKPCLIACPEISKLNLELKFDIIWAFSVLIHMSDEILGKTLNFIQSHLSEDGIFYANVNIGKREESTWQGFPIVFRSLDFYNDTCSANGLRVSELGPLKDLGHISNKPGQDNQIMLKITRFSDQARLAGV